MSPDGERLHLACDTIPNVGRSPLHVADLDGWRLRYSADDLGNHIVSARQLDSMGEIRNIHGFDVSYTGRDPAPVYTTTDPSLMGWLAELIERAEWREPGRVG